MTDNGRTSISNAKVEVVSYPRNEGEPYNRIGEILYVAITFPNGQRLLHRDIFPCFTDDLTPEDARSKADKMAKQIVESGSINPKYWYKDCHHFIGKHPLGPRLGLADIRAGDLLIAASSMRRIVDRSDLGIALLAGVEPCADQYEFELTVSFVNSFGVLATTLRTHRWGLHDSPEDVEVESTEEDPDSEPQILPLEAMALFRHPSTK